MEEAKILDSVRYGVICNVEMVATALAGILDRLEKRLEPRKVESVYVSVGGLSTASVGVEVDRRLPDEMEITSHLIDQLRKEAMSTRFTGKDIVAMEPKAFYIDKRLTEHPEGTWGHSIKAEFNLILSRSQAKCNINRVIVDKLGLGINGYIVRQLAEADVVLSSEEKRLGCMLVDFGAETTTVSIYRKGILVYMATIPLGSRNITKDLMTIHHLEEKAEEIKKMGGSAIPSSSIDHRSSGVDFTESNNFVAARAGEIIANIKAQLDYAGLKPADLPAGIVIIGNGARLREFNNRLEAVSKLKVRQGLPTSALRISDSSIQPSGAIDIIAVLSTAASLPDVVDCMPEPEPEIVETPEVVIEEEVKVPEPEIVAETPKKPEPEPNPEPEPKRRTSFLGSWGSRIARIMRGPDDDEDDFNDDDD